MIARQTDWPREWLITDERMGERLWIAIERLPPSEAGIVLRHYSLAPDMRESLAKRVAATRKKRGLTLGIAADVELAKKLGADFVHNPSAVPSDIPFSRSVHSIAEAEAARSEGASLVFVSAVHASRSHPGRAPLRRELAIRIAEAAGVPAIALGGMDASRFAALAGRGFYGWAGIDAWLRI
jgi:thiamine-phosphate pyrophosphorylase